MKYLPLLLVFACMLACTPKPEIGSEQWCQQLDKIPEDSWTVEQAKAYATHCLFK